MMLFRLVIRSGPDIGKVIPVDGPLISIGREKSNDIVINDIEVSRKHALMRFENGSYLLQDNGSTNGTFVDGDRLMGPLVLHGGEIISLGENTSLVFEALPVEANLPAEVSAAPEPVIPAVEEAETVTPPEVIAEPVVEETPEPSVSQPPPDAIYAGQVPAYARPAGRKKISIWLILAILGLVLVCCVVTGLVIDATRSWCYIGGWFFNILNPGACP